MNVLIIVLAVIIVVLILWQWRHQRLLSLRARLMREALRNRDFTFRLPADRLFPGERDLQLALNDMGGEINRLLARSEVESWQRLTRVLTHEIMNSVAPIQSITHSSRRGNARHLRHKPRSVDICRQLPQTHTTATG